MKRIFVMLAGLMLALLISGCPKEGGKSGEEPGMKVGFVYIGPVGDAGWTLSHDKGRKYLEEQLTSVKTTYVENVAESSDAERFITNLAMQGNKVIFTTSYGYMDATLNVAKKFPQVVFMHCSGYKTAPNVGTYFGRMYQARYLSGIVAGKMTKSNIIGYVAANPIPEVVRGINAFTLGVRKVNPKAKVKVVWTHVWYDPPAEREAAESLLDFKADVIAQHQDTYAPQQAAQERGKFSIGYNTDMATFAPKAHLTAPVWNWGPYYAKVVKSVQDGTWKSGSYWGGMEEGIVGLAPFGPMVPREVQDLVKAEREKIEAAATDKAKPGEPADCIFSGPLKDNTGTLRVKKGEKLTDDQLLKIDWFVEGVEGKVETGQRLFEQVPQASMSLR
ncbi:MAG: BMP family ABC transporter substrate-binding protein [Candidatus Eremiobacteraeota bacterium]|nr:BMP family ABC transporter substrate-binding protein [Candidatus Eremiobacteraeota bacterium]